MEHKTNLIDRKNDLIQLIAIFNKNVTLSQHSFSPNFTGI